MSNTSRGSSSAARQRTQHAAVTRRRRLRVKWVVAAAGLAAALVVLVLTLPSGGDDNDSTSVRATPGSPTLDIEMVDFDGVTFSLRDYLGTPVVLNFWASWCPFCVAEMPDFERVHQQVSGDVAFVGVNLQDDRGQAERLVADTGVTYRLAADRTGVVYGAFGGTAMPTTVFIDAEGTVRQVVAGQMSESQLLETIERNFQVAS